MRFVFSLAAAGLAFLAVPSAALSDPIETDLGALENQLGIDLGGINTPGTQASAEVRWGNNLLAPENQLTDEGASSASISGGFSGAENFAGSATATAATDSLGVTVSSVATDSPFFVNAASGFAVFTDTITVEDGSPGTAGRVTFSFDIEGSSTVSGDSNLAASLYVIQTRQDGVSFADINLNFPDGDFTFETEEFDIVSGESFDLTVVFGLTGLVTGADPFSGTGTAIGEYGETVTLKGIDTFDGAGGVWSTSILRASAVPEPSSTAIVCLCFAGLVMRRRRGELVATSTTPTAK